MTVYFIGALEINRVKIGYTKDAVPKTRLKDMQPGSPCKLELLAYGPGDMAVEAALHRECIADHVLGEWFTLSDNVRTVMSRVQHQCH